MDLTVTAWVTESTPQNESDWEEFNRTLDMAFLITDLLQFIISLVGLAGNAVVLCLLGFHMQRNAFSVYILNLAGADFVYLSIRIVYSIKSFVNNSNLDFLSVSLFFFKMFVFPYVASLSILTAISTERCLSVLQPLWYRYRRPNHMSSVICALIWALSLLLSTLRMGFYGFLFGEPDRYLSELIDLSIATWLIFSFALLFGSSLVLLTRLLCGSQKRRLTRLYVTIWLTVLVFLLCGLPTGIHWFFLRWMPITYNMHTFTLTLVTEVLSCVNSCANPIIYFFVGSYRQQQRQQRRSLKLILQRALQNAPEEEGSQSSPPHETLEISENKVIGPNST